MKKDDISPIAAIGLLVLVLLMFFGLSNYEDITFYWPYLQKAFEETKIFLLIGLTSFCVNALILTLILERVLGYKKQGSRLRSIKKDKVSEGRVFLRLLLSLLLACLFWNLVGAYVEHGLLPYGQILSPKIIQYLSGFFSGSFLLSVSIVSYGLLSTLLTVKRVLKIDKVLPRKSRFKEHLTLGSVGEESGIFDKSESPKWLAIPQKALNGNILVTGSIGTGKTQGTILNYIDQLFSQFSHTPAALILDPKGSFIGKAAKILKEHGLASKCVYLGDTNANI